MPIKQKDAVQKKFKEAVDAMFGVLRGSERDRSMNRFKERLQGMKSQSDKRMRSERYPAPSGAPCCKDAHARHADACRHRLPT